MLSVLLLKYPGATGYEQSVTFACVQNIICEGDEATPLATMRSRISASRGAASIKLRFWAAMSCRPPQHLTSGA